MTAFATNVIKPVIPTPGTVSTTNWSNVFQKLTDATITEQQDVGTRRLKKLRIYNADTVQSIVSVRKNAGTLIQPKNTIQLFKTEVESGETLVIDDIELGENEQLDIQLAANTTTNPVECSAQGESF